MRTRWNTRVVREMPSLETSPLELLPATISAVEGNDSILIRCPFDTCGNKAWFLHQLNKAASEK